MPGIAGEPGVPTPSVRLVLFKVNDWATVLPVALAVSALFLTERLLL